MTTYYISDVDGAATNSGQSPSTPWNTSKFNDVLYGPGGLGIDVDTILFKGGETIDVGSLYFAPSNAQSPVFKLSSYGNGRATLKGGVGVDLIFSERGLTIDRLNFSGPAYKAGDTPNGHGLAFYVAAAGLYPVSVSDCKFTGFNRSISIGGESSTVSFSVNVNRVQFKEHYDEAIQFFNLSPSTRSSTAIVRNCSVEPLSGNGIVLSACSNSLIDKCTGTGDRSQLTVSVADNLFWFYNANTSTIQDSVAINTKGLVSATDAGGFGIDIDCNGCIIQRCVAINCYGQGFLVMTGSNNIIRNNIAIDCGTKDISGDQGAIAISSSGAAINPSTINVSVVHNVVYFSSGIEPTTRSLVAFRLGANPITGTVANNIFYSEGSRQHLSLSDTSTTSLKIHQNLYFCVTGSSTWGRGGVISSSLSAFRSGSHEIRSGANTGLQANPLFVSAGKYKASAYRLQSGSPALAAGTNLSTLTPAIPTGSDYDQNAYPAATATNLGAYQPLTPKLEMLLSGPSGEVGHRALVYSPNIDTVVTEVALAERSEAGVYRAVVSGLADGDYLVQSAFYESIGGSAPLNVVGGLESAGATAPVDTGAVATAVWASATRSLTDKAGFALSSAGISAIWAETTRTLTGFGTLAADVWASATRSLTAAVTTDAASRTASQATGFATPANVTAVITAGDARWITATGFNTVTPDNTGIGNLLTRLSATRADKLDTVATTATANTYKADTAGLATGANVTASQTAIITAGSAWTTANLGPTNTAIADIPTNPLLASSYIAPNNAGIGLLTALLNAGNTAFTATALQFAPTGSGGGTALSTAQAEKLAAIPSDNALAAITAALSPLSTAIAAVPTNPLLAPNYVTPNNNGIAQLTALLTADNTALSAAALQFAPSGTAADLTGIQSALTAILDQATSDQAKDGEYYLRYKKDTNEEILRKLRTVAPSGRIDLKEAAPPAP